MAFASRIIPVLVNSTIAGQTFGPAPASARGAPRRCGSGRTSAAVGREYFDNPGAEKTEKGQTAAPRFPSYRSRIFSKNFSIASSAKRHSDAAAMSLGSGSLSAKTDTWSLTIMLLPSR